MVEHASEIEAHASELEADSGPSDKFYLLPKARPTAEHLVFKSSSYLRFFELGSKVFLPAVH
jgi:hypothetical protein